jgi:hypothetical protein
MATSHSRLVPPSRGTVTALRKCLMDADYTVDGVTGLLGEVAHRALLRDVSVPGMRALAGHRGPLATLTRLWPLQSGVPLAEAEQALPGLVEPLAAAGLLIRSGEAVRALADVRPYGDDTSDWWVACDLTPGLDGGSRRIGTDHVLGISPASTTLAQLAVRDPVGRALDLGTGCGVQSLHLATHADEVVATDVNERALAMAAITAALSDVDFKLRAGSLYAPVAGEQFDLVLTNPPFVVSPAVGERLVYRDSGLPGDEVVRRIVTGAPSVLSPGGWCQVLANWAHVDGQPWESRIAEWVTGTGCDAWVVQRELVDPAEYAQMWLADAGLAGAPGWAAAYDAWLGWFADQGIEGIGMGWLSLRRTERDEPVVVIEDFPYEIEQPLGVHVRGWGRRVGLLASADDDVLLSARPVRADDVVQETYGPPGAADPERIVLRRQRGVRRARSVDTVVAALVGACDGELTTGQIVDALAALLDAEAAVLRADTLPVLRELVAEGWLDF